MNPFSSLMKSESFTASRRIDDDVFPAIIGGIAVFFLVLAFILLCKKIPSRSRHM